MGDDGPKQNQLGVDDYMVKPIELDEPLLRVRALPRRAGIRDERKLTAGNLVLDADGMTAEVGRDVLKATVRNFFFNAGVLRMRKQEESRENCGCIYSVKSGQNLPESRGAPENR